MDRKRTAMLVRIRRVIMRYSDAQEFGTGKARRSIYPRARVAPVRKCGVCAAALPAAQKVHGRLHRHGGSELRRLLAPRFQISDPLASPRTACARAKFATRAAHLLRPWWLARGSRGPESAPLADGGPRRDRCPG